MIEQDNTSRLVSIIKWHPTDGAAAVGIEREYLLIKRRELLPVNYNSTNGEYDTASLGGSAEGVSPEEAKRRGLAWLALSGHLESQEGSPVADAEDMSGRRDALARALTSDYMGGPHPYAATSAGIKRAVDLIIQREDKEAA